MPGQSPDFYLGSTEHGGDLAVPRSCRVRGRPVGPYGAEYLLIDVLPPLIGQNYGLGGEDISVLIISPHFESESFSAFTTRPVSVYIYRILDWKLLATMKFNTADVEMMGWGEIYPTLEAAKQASSSPR